MRSLRLRLLKSDSIDKAQFQITSVQDDNSELKLSTGSIFVDLLQKHENFRKEGTVSLELPYCSFSVIMNEGVRLKYRSGEFS